MSEMEINDYLSKYDEDLANNVMYRVYGMPGPIFMEENNDTPTPEPGPKSIPFYVENITQNEETLTIAGYDAGGGYLEFPVEYSTDGDGWSSLGTTGATPLTRTLQPGDKVYLRATTNTWNECQDSEEPYIDHGCSIYGVSKVGGDVMSLLYGSSFNGNETTFPSGSTRNLGSLFHDRTGNDGYNRNLVSASELILPATTLTEYCYTTMFWHCTALTTVPVLPATTLAFCCYSSMFHGCSSLTTAPELPATTLAPNCYSSMFNGCSSLTTAPSLPATTLVENCYGGMFWNCTALTTAPVLPVTTLADWCYGSMFRGCTNLNYIKCLATDISASDCIKDWTSGVALTGTFIKNPNMSTSTWGTGVNGIPSGWTVEDAA